MQDPQLDQDPALQAAQLFNLLGVADVDLECGDSDSDIDEAYDSGLDAE